MLFQPLFKVLSELVKDITSKLHKSEYDRKQLGQKLTDVKESVDQAEVIQKVKEKFFNKLFLPPNPFLFNFHDII